MKKGKSIQVFVVGVFLFLVAYRAILLIDINFLGINLYLFTPTWRPMLHYFIAMLAGMVILQVCNKLFP